MKTEITSNIATEITESKGLTLKRARVEEATADKDRILGMDYPAGIILTD
jgi:hypothetical protein